MSYILKKCRTEHVITKANFFDTALNHALHHPDYHLTWELILDEAKNHYYRKGQAAFDFIYEGIAGTFTQSEFETAYAKALTFCVAMNEFNNFHFPRLQDLDPWRDSQ